MEERIGIVILNYKTWEKTVSCVQSIYETYRQPKEIVIVDNKSPNDSFEQLSEKFPISEFPDIRVISTERNGGFSYGNNFGFRYISENHHDITKVVITNNDIIFEDGSIQAMISAFEAYQDVCVTAPVIHDTDGNKTNIPWKKRQTLIQFMGLKSAHDCHFEWQELDKMTSVYMVSGCCFAVDVQRFYEIGCLDENVFLYMEEGILASRVLDRGYKIVFTPLSNITHDHGATTGNGNVFVDKEIVKSAMYYLKAYEHRSRFVILLIYIFFIGKIYIKYFFKRYKNTRGINSLITDTFLWYNNK